MTKKFYKMTLAERHEFLLQNSNLKAEDLETWLPSAGLSFETADHMIENAVGLFSLPLGIAQNFIVNGKPVLVPMVVEEPSWWLRFHTWQSWHSPVASKPGCTPRR